MKLENQNIFIYLFVCLIFSCSEVTEPENVPPDQEEGPSISSTRIYVALSGDDSRSKTEANNPLTPWKTIQKAVDNISAGDTLFIAGGTYHEKVAVTGTASGTAAKPTLIRNMPGQTVILDGKNEGNQWESLFKITSAEHIEVRGLKAKNGFWYGFSADETNNIKFDSLFTDNTRASGIYARVTSFIEITNNNIRRACQAQERDAQGNGTQECITVGRTDNFKISHNEIWDVPLTGEGGEGIDAKGGCFDGEISHNYVHDIERVGIYLDAGSHEEYNIRVFSNRVINCGGGLSVAGELGGHIRDIYLYNNILVNNTRSGVLFQNIMNGRFSNIYIVNNTLFNNGQVGFAGDIANFSQNELNTNLQIVNNVFYNKTDNYRFSIFHNIAAPHVIHNNLYFDFKPGWAGGVNNFSQANLTASDIQADPLFTNIGSKDYTLKADSPAIGKGVPMKLPDGTLLFNTDYNGKTRGESAWDLGAFEH
ncbi:right-handed parallel beta-helix repeat-containing protein [Aquiflexum sp.]|uniref:right-handed parallel beta-helix repeat-containing protein n=1 Tax=Aquiflexum sp. TaxID=1872584 RepID=UPI003592EC55